MRASGIEFEFDLAGEIDLNHLLTISKSRCPALANTTHLNPGQELAEVLRDWLSDGSPLLESPESKCQRVRVAREAAGLGTDSVRHLIEAEFDGRTSPQQLSIGECDRLVAMLEGVRRSA